jgi:4-amino-4-deoxy-L-arabinose transferase-like glycosyltransferase
MNRRLVLLSIVLIYTATFRLLVLNRSFEYDPEGSGCLNALLARSYLRFDLTRSHGMPVLSLAPAPAMPIVFYPDHPPLLPLLIVPFYARFGVGEWQTRLPISLMTIAAVFVLYRLLSCFATERVGLIAAAVFAATPMTLYFGGFPDVDGLPLILFVLLVLDRYLHFHRAAGVHTLVPLVGAFVLAGACDWPAYVMVPVMAGHFLATRPRNAWPWVLAFAVVACALFAFIYVYIALATGSPWNWMVPLFSRRSGFGVRNPFTLRQWLNAAIRFNRTYHTLPLLVASALWVAGFGVRLRGSLPGATVARLLLAWGALSVLIGRTALYDHEWAW